MLFVYGMKLINLYRDLTLFHTEYVVYSPDRHPIGVAITA